MHMSGHKMNNDFYAPKDSFKDEILHIRAKIKNLEDYISLLQTRKMTSKYPEIYDELIELDNKLINRYQEDIRELINGL